MAYMGLAAAGKNRPPAIKHRDSLIPALFDVVVRQGSCEDDPIPIRNRISAASIPRRARKNKHTAFRCISCAEKMPSPECSATRFSAEKAARAGRRGNSSARRWVARPNAAQDRHLGVESDVK